MLEEIMTEYFPNLAKDIKRQIQQVEQTPNKINPKKFNPRYTTIIKLLKTKDTEFLKEQKIKDT